MSGRWHGGKGSTPRKSQVPQKQVDANWDLAFGKKEPESKEQEKKPEKRTEDE